MQKASRWVALVAVLLVIGSILGAHPAPASDRVSSPTAGHQIGSAAASEAVSLFGGGG